MRMAQIDRGGDLPEIGPAPAQREHIGNRPRGIDQSMRVAAGAAIIGTFDKAHELRVVHIHEDPPKPQAAGQRHDNVACLMERGQTALLFPITTHLRTPNPPAHGRLKERLAKAGGEGNTPVAGISHAIRGTSIYAILLFSIFNILGLSYDTVIRAVPLGFLKDMSCWSSSGRKRFNSSLVKRCRNSRGETPK